MEPSWRDGSDWEFKVNVTNSLVLEFRKVNYRAHKLEACVLVYTGIKVEKLRTIRFNSFKKK